VALTCISLYATDHVTHLAPVLQASSTAKRRKLEHVPELELRNSLLSSSNPAKSPSMMPAMCSALTCNGLHVTRQKEAILLLPVSFKD